MTTTALIMNNNGSHHRYSLSALDEIQRIQQEICDLMEQKQYCSRDIFCVRLALDESLTNAIRHGNRHDPSKEVQLAYHVSDDNVWLEVEDEGEGFRIEDVPDPTDPKYVDRPGGRGVHCIFNFMCEVEYNERGNRIRMRKYRANRN